MRTRIIKCAISGKRLFSETIWRSCYSEKERTHFCNWIKLGDFYFSTEEVLGHGGATEVKNTVSIPKVSYYMKKGLLYPKAVEKNEAEYQADLKKDKIESLYEKRMSLFKELSGLNIEIIKKRFEIEKLNVELKESEKDD